jgi:hypothetical protein
VEAFMLSGPVIALVLEGHNVIARVRKLLGVTDSRLAAPGTIRGEFGVDKTVNVAHVSGFARSGGTRDSAIFCGGRNVRVNRPRIPFSSPVGIFGSRCLLHPCLFQNSAPNLPQGERTTKLA